MSQVERLFQAAKNGDVNTLRDCVARGVSLDACDKVGCTALHWASHRQHLAAAQYLISEGAPVNAQDAQDKCALHFAAFRGNLALCQELVEHGALLDVQSRTGETPLHMAAFKGSATVVDYLLSKNASADLRANDGESPLQKAALLRKPDAVRLLLTGGADWEVLLRDRADSTYLLDVKSRPAPTPRVQAPATQTPRSSAAAAAQRPASGAVSRSSSVKPRSAAAGQDGNKALLEAARAGDVDRARVALGACNNVDAAARGGSVEYPDAGEWTALHWAAYTGNLELAQVLLAARSAISLIDSCGFTPLHLAASQGQVSLVQLLVDSGASVTQECDCAGTPSAIRWRTPVHSAAAGGYDEVVTLLLSSGAQVDALDAATRTPLHLAAKYNKLQVVSALLCEGADPGKATKLGATALHMAAWAGALELCKALVESRPGELAGTSPLSLLRDANDKTPADVAMARNHVKVSAFLAKVALASLPPPRASPLSRTTSKIPSHSPTPAPTATPARPASAAGNRTPNGKQAPSGPALLKAATDGDLAAVKAHLSAGVDTGYSGAGVAMNVGDATVDSGWTALHWAAYTGAADVVRLLLEKGVDANSRTDSACTPLHVAAKAGNKKVVQLLLLQGAVPYLQAYNGFTPAHYALAASHAGTALVLIAALPQGLLDATSQPEGQTLLHIAAARGLGDVVKVLVAAGANVNARDMLGKGDAGCTPLDWAAHGGYTDVCRTLVAAGAKLAPDPSPAPATPTADTTPSDPAAVTPAAAAEAAAAAAAALGVYTSLWYAVDNARLEAATYLISEAGAKTDACTPNGATLLHTAAQQGSSALELVRLLLNTNSYQANVQDNSGKTPLHWAVIAGSVEVVQLLVDSGAANATADKAGRSPVDIAQTTKRQDLVDILQLADNKVALLEAAKAGDLEALQACLSKGGISANISGDGTTMDSRYWWCTDGSWTALHWAAYSGQAAVVEYLLSSAGKADVSAATSGANTALHTAAKGNQAEIIKALIKGGASVNAVNSNTQTPLHIAASEGSVTCVKALLDGGADYNAKDNGNDEALDSAASSGNLEIVKLLYELGGEVLNEARGCYSSLINAAKAGHLEVSKYLVEVGADLATVDSSNSQAFTPLHCAVSSGNDDLVQYFVTKLPKPELANTTDAWYTRTPLHFASESGHLEMVRSLLGVSGVDVNAQDSSNKTALHFAASSNSAELVKLLLERGAEPDVSDGTYRPLFQASQYGYTEVVRLLLGTGAVDVNATGGWSKDSPLTAAVQNNATENVRLLLDAGADISCVNDSGRPSLLLAAAYNYGDIVKLLVERGAPAGATDQSSRGVLHLAGASGASVELLQQLAQAPGCDACIVDSSGQTAAEAAAASGFEAQATLLRELETAAASKGAITRALKLEFLGAARDGALSKVQDLLAKGVPVGATVPCTGVIDTLTPVEGADPNFNGGQGWSALHVSAYAGQDAVLAHLLQQKDAQVDACKGSDAATALHAGAAAGKVAAVTLLLAAGAKETACRADGYNALHIAAELGRTDVVKLLLLTATAVDAPTTSYLARTALHMACLAGNTEVAKLLLAHKADASTKDGYGMLALLLASEAGQSAVVKLLLSKGVAVDGRDPAFNYTPLNKAAAAGKLEVVKLLVEAGADINIDDNPEDNTALAVAAVNAKVDVVNYLLSRPGVDVDDTDTSGRTAMHDIAACTGGAADADLANIVAALITAKAKADLADSSGVTPLHLAAGNGYLECVKRLTGAGAAVDAAGSDGMTPLLMAAKAGSVAVARHLMSLGASVTAVDSTGQGVLHWAASARSAAAAGFFLNKGAPSDLTTSDYYKRTPLHYASQSGDLEVAKVLVETAGADPTPTDGNGWNPSAFAGYSGYSALETYLQQASATWDAVTPVKSADAAALLKAVSANDLEAVKALVTGDAPKAPWDTPLAGLQLADGSACCVSSTSEPVYTVLAGWTTLHWAAYSGSLEVLAFLLGPELAAFVDSTDNGGRTPLHIAAFAGQLEAAKALLKRDANVGARDKDLCATPLMYATMAGHAELVQLLLSKGSEVSSKDSQDFTALHWASQLGQLTVIAYLIKKGALPDAVTSIGRTPLHVAVVGGQQKAAALLLKSNVNVDVRDTNNSDTPLDLAATAGDVEMVKVLLRGKAAVINPDKSGGCCSSLLTAASAQNMEICRLLLAAGASIESAGADGISVLGYAAMCSDLLKSVELAKLALGMIKSKEAIDAPMSWIKRTPLMYATDNNNLELMKLLIAKGASLTATDSDSQTALHIACLSGSASEAAKLLLASGADPNAMDSSNRSPLHKASDYDRREIVKVLLACPGVRSDAQCGWSQNTALHCAAQSGYVEVTRMLLDAGASPLALDNSSNSALACAVQCSVAVEICELLMERGSNVSGLDCYSRTLLHISAGSGNLGMCKILMADGADINAINQWGQTPTEVAPSYYEEVKTYLQGLEDASAAAGGVTKKMKQSLLSAACDGVLVRVQSYVDDSGVPVDAKVPGVALWEQAAYGDAKYNVGQGWSALHVAAFTGKLDILDYLVGKGATVDAVADDQATPLLVAVLGGQAATVRALAKAGANLAARRSDEACALHIAAEANKLEVLKVLLESKADLTAVNSSGCTALHSAAAAGSLDIVKALLDAGSEIEAKSTPAERTALYMAAAAGKADVVAYLLGQGAAVDAVDCNKYTPLQQAAGNGFLDTVKVLVQANADINREDNSQSETALKMAAANGQSEVVALLLVQSGVDVLDADSYGRTALHAIAMSYMATDDALVVLARQLIAAKAVVDAVDSEGNTPLKYAAGRGFYEVVKVLVEAGADVNKANNSLETPLLAAAASNALQVCKYLVDAGADPERVDGSGRTDLMVAATTGSLDLVTFLINHGAFVNAINASSKQCVLHYAVASGSKEMVTYLLDVAGANPTFADVYDNTPARQALSYGYTEIAKSLQDAQDAFAAQTLCAQKDPLMLAAKKGDLAALKALLSPPAAVAVDLALPGMLLAESESAMSDAQYKVSAGWTALHWAAASGQTQAATYLLSRGALPDARDSQGLTPLHAACWKGQLEVIKLLIGKKASIDAKSSGGLCVTPAICAAAAGRSEAIQTLIRNGVDLSLADASGNTALHWASRMGQLVLVQYLLKKGLRCDQTNVWGQTALHVACVAGQAKSVLALIKTANASVNTTDSSNCTPADGAAAAGSVDALRHLVKAKAVLVNAAQSGCYSSLLAAAQAAKPAAVKYLLAQGADPALPDNTGRNAMHYAAMGGSAEVIAMLLKKAKRPNELVNSVDGWWTRTPFFWAASMGKPEALKALLAGGVSDINARDNSGNTALMMAVSASENCAETVSFLLTAGADAKLLATCPASTTLWWMVCSNSSSKTATLQALLDARTCGDINLPCGWSPQTPLSAAAQNNADLVPFLLASPDINLAARDGDGSTALHWAAGCYDDTKRGTLVQQLLDAGMALNAVRSSDGSTALHVAACCGFLDTVKVLVEYVPSWYSAAATQRTVRAGAAAAAQTDATAAADASAAVLAERTGADVFTVNNNGSLASESASGSVDVAAYLQQAEKDATAAGAVSRADKQALLTAAREADVVKFKELLATKPMPLDVCVPGWAIFDVDAQPAAPAPGEAVVEPDPAFTGGKGWSPLHIAAYNGSTELLQYLLSQNVPLGTLGPNDGLSALHVAASRGKLGVVRLLIEAHTSVTLTTPDGLQALHVAAQRGNVDVTRFLVGQSVVSVDALTTDKSTALHLAALAGKVEVVRLLMAKGAHLELVDSSGRSPAFAAAGAGKVDTLRLLLARGATIEAPAGSFGSSALQLAAAAGYLDTVKALTEAGADVNAGGSGNRPPLSLAAAGFFHGIVSHLLAKGAKADAVTDGSTALHCLASGYNTQQSEGDRAATVKALLDANTPVDALDSNGFPALLYAAGAGQADTARLLIAAGANANLIAQGRNALMAACDASAIEVVTLLVGAGADVGVLDSDGCNLLHRLSNNWSVGSEMPASLWAAPGAADKLDVNAVVSSSGRTALHGAAQRGSKEYVKWLLDTRGADPTVVDSSGSTACALCKGWGWDYGDYLQEAEDAWKAKSAVKAAAVPKGRK